MLDGALPEERAIARTVGSGLFLDAMRARLEDLDRSTTIALACHYRNRDERLSAV